MAKGLFDNIAPIYNLFFNYQIKNYRRVLNVAKDKVYLPKQARILDIGCGTGALCYVLNEQGYHVTGVDASPEMICQAQKHNRQNEINFAVANVFNGLNFKDKSFDIVISAYVAHGMQKPERKKLYREAARLAKERIILHDYNQQRSFITDLAEWLEGGDYFNFIGIVESELKDYFGRVQVINVGKRSAWYIV